MKIHKHNTQKSYGYLKKKIFLSFGGTVKTRTALLLAELFPGDKTLHHYITKNDQFLSICALSFFYLQAGLTEHFHVYTDTRIFPLQQDSLCCKT